MLWRTPIAWRFSPQRVGKGKEAVGKHLLPLPPLGFVKRELRAAGSILRSEEDPAGWPLSKVRLLGLLRECSSGTVPSVSKKPGGGLILRPLGFWVIDFVNASCDFSADLLGLSQASSSSHVHWAVCSPLDRPPCCPLGPHSCRHKPSDQPWPEVSLYKSRKTKDIAYNLQVFRIE